MERATIIVKGDVQRVGYRDFVEKMARKNRLTGCVDNIKPYDVRVIVEGDKEDIDIFLRQIDIKRHPIAVDSIESSFGKPSGEYEYFEIKRGDMVEELAERIDMAGSVMYEIRDLQRDSGSVMYELRDLQKESLKKQDQTMEKIDSGNKMLGEKIDSGNKYLGEKIDSGNKIVAEKIDSGNKYLGGKMDSVGDKLDCFHNDTIHRFDIVDEKYGKISRNLDRAIESINKTSENIERILEKSEKDRNEFQKHTSEMFGVMMKLLEKKA